MFARETLFLQTHERMSLGPSPTFLHSSLCPSHLGARGSPTAGRGASWQAPDAQEHAHTGNGSASGGFHFLQKNEIRKAEEGPCGSLGRPAQGDASAIPFTYLSPPEKPHASTSPQPVLPAGGLNHGHRGTSEGEGLCLGVRESMDWGGKDLP